MVSIKQVWQSVKGAVAALSMTVGAAAADEVCTPKEQTFFPTERQVAGSSNLVSNDWATFDGGPGNDLVWVPQGTYKYPTGNVETSLNAMVGKVPAGPTIAHARNSYKIHGDEPEGLEKYPGLGSLHMHLADGKDHRVIVYFGDIDPADSKVPFSYSVMAHETDGFFGLGAREAINTNFPPVTLAQTNQEGLAALSFNFTQEAFSDRLVTVHMESDASWGFVGAKLTYLDCETVRPERSDNDNDNGPGGKTGGVSDAPSPGGSTGL